MKNILIGEVAMPSIYLKKTIRTLKLIIAFMLTSMLQLSANSYSQNSLFNLEVQNITIEQLFKQIENDSDYSFFYKDNEINITDKVYVNVKDKPITEVLDQAFVNKNISYTIKNRHIILSSKTEKDTANFRSVKQQAILIKGTVKDSEGEPLPGVSISIVNTTEGVLTDIDGKFSITVPNSNAELQFSYVGFVVQQLKVGTQRTMDVIMHESESTLEEIVVVGYGTQKKTSIVGSVQSIRVDELKVPSSNLSTGFAGRMAGVIAVQRSGEPGADGADFWIRGISTLGDAATNPLIIIDGVKASSGDLNALDAEIIESFSILKDATATALYGTRGANGVMIVTTKSGRDLAKPIVNARFETSYTSPVKTPKFVNGTTYMNMYNESVTTRSTGEILYTKDKIDGTMRAVDPYVFPNVNWYDELFRSGAINQNLNLNIRGGGSRVDYFSSVSVNHDSGMLRNTKNFSYDNNLSITRYVLQNNINVYITPTTKASVKINAQLRDYHGPHTSANSLFGMVMEANPVDFPIRYPDDSDYDHIKWGGKLGGKHNNGQRNPYAEMARGYSDNFQSTVNGVIEFNQKLDFFTKGLSANAMFSFKNWSSTNTSRSGDYNQYEVSGFTWGPDRNTISDYKLRRVGEEQKTVLNTKNGSSGDRQIYVQTMVNYDRTFNQIHNLTGMFLYNQEEFNVNNPDGLIASLPKRKQGIAGRFTYAYDNKYLGEVNFGYNGSENFAKGHRIGFFPSVGLGYIISQEEYFEPLTNVITHLKLRGSWGLVGNDAVDNSRFLYLSDIQLEHSDLGYTTGRDQNVSKNGPKYIRYGNPSITWEVGEKMNIGLDLGILNNFNVAIDFFSEIRRDIFINRKSIPEFVGISYKDRWTDLTTDVYGNLGKVKNTGFDASVDFNKQLSKDLFVSLKGTFSFARNKVLAEDEPAYAKYPNLSRVGHSVNTPLLYIADRLFIDDAEVANSPTQNIGGYIGAGDIKYVNQPDAEGNYDDVIDANDRRYTGHPTTPEIVYGFGPSFQYKKFDFSFFFQGVARTSILMKDFHPFGNNGSRNVLQYIADDYWSADSNPNIYAKYPRLSRQDNPNNTTASTNWLRNGAFLKLKNAEVGFNHKLFRVYLRGSNLLTFSEFKHWDPEQGSGSGLKYPTQRVVNLGVQISFNK